MAEINKTTSSNVNVEISIEQNDISPIIQSSTNEILSSPSNNIKKDSEQYTIHGTIIPLQINIQKLLQNKLKRKKKITSSLISVNGADERHTINEKKRTKIEKNNSQTQQGNKENCDKLTDDSSNVVVTKPPLPPKTIEKQNGINMKIPPPRQKRKMEENSTVIQKLNAQSEQLRLEISELKNALSTEKNAVRTLRAQYESDNRKSKNEIKKLQTALEAMKKVVTTNQQQKLKATIKDDINPITKDHSNVELNKLNQEIAVLKDVNRILEEKIRICNDGERRKSLYTQELTDSYEIRLTQISKSAKNEISRLLEEIKTKERNIGQLKKEINSNKNNLTNNQIKNNKDTRIVQHPTEMKKLKDVEATATNKNCVNNDTNNKEKLNNIKNITTCSENEFNSEQHDINERIMEAHQKLIICRNPDTMNSDSDSALSSAPQSISPQPPTSGEQDRIDIWQTVRNCTKELESLKSENNLIQKENELLKNDLQLAKQQIKEFEKTVFEANNNNIKLQQLKDRIRYLEEKERDLLKESHELREQNELMEFRILELEESHDKWSLRSNSTPDTKEMWTDTEKEHDDLLIFTDRSDSGVTSPHSQNNIDDRNIISPCDLSLLDPMSNDEIKRRITLLSKKPNIDEDDKMCLLQIIHLINNLDAISNDSIMNCNTDDSISLELIKSKFSDYIQSSSITSSSRLILQSSDKSNSNNKNSRIVATVLPYSSSLSTPTESPSRKYRSWTTSSLQESGVFEGDSTLDSYYCQSTQTEPEDFPCQLENHPSTKDLCAEIQKLNKYREQIEECVIKSTATQPTTATTAGAAKTNNNNNKIVPQIQLSPNLSDQKRIQYYKERLELLENKLIIYESSGDVQLKLLADRLQREIQLQSVVKDLREKVDKLYELNQQLEEEKCEFEEAENDTRLRLQRLEIDLEIYSQRNTELEMSREVLQNKLKESKNQCSNLQYQIDESEQKIENLVDDTKDLTNRIQLIKMSMPAILLFNTFMIHGNGAQYNPNNVNNNHLQPTHSQLLRINDQYRNNEQQHYDDIDQENQKDNNDMDNEFIKKYGCFKNEQQQTEYSSSPPKNDQPKPQSSLLEQQLYNLQSRERELNMNIAELNRAYQETMENADCLWAQIEKDYKDKLAIAECNEQFMRTKINQLEDRLRNDYQIAQERINQLEESESEYKHRYCKLNKEYRDICNEHDSLTEEYQNMKDNYNKMKKYCDGPGRQSLDLEKGRCKNLQVELDLTRGLLAEAEENHKNDIDRCTAQSAKIKNDLSHIQVTNSELQEEVLTLEKQVAECTLNKRQYDDKLRTLLDELRNKDEIIINLECRLNNLNCNHNDICRCYTQTLEEELNYGKRSKSSGPDGPDCSKRFKIDDVRDLRTASLALGQVIECVKECERCEPDTKEIQDMALEVKELADRILGIKSSDETEVSSKQYDSKNIKKEEVKNDKSNGNDDDDDNDDKPENDDNNKSNNDGNNNNDDDSDNDDKPSGNGQGIKIEPDNNDYISNIKTEDDNNVNNNIKESESEEEFKDVIEDDIDANEENIENNTDTKKFDVNEENIENSTDGKKFDQNEDNIENSKFDPNEENDKDTKKSSNEVIINYAFIQTPVINFEYFPDKFDFDTNFFQKSNDSIQINTIKNLTTSISTPAITNISEVPSIIRKLTESKKELIQRTNIQLPTQQSNICTQTDSETNNIIVEIPENDYSEMPIDFKENEQSEHIENDFSNSDMLIKNTEESGSLESVTEIKNDFDVYLTYDQYDQLTEEIANMNNQKSSFNDENISKYEHFDNVNEDLYNTLSFVPEKDNVMSTYDMENDTSDERLLKITPIDTTPYENQNFLENIPESDETVESNYQIIIPENDSELKATIKCDEHTRPTTKIVNDIIAKLNRIYASTISENEKESNTNIIDDLESNSENNIQYKAIDLMTNIFQCSNSNSDIDKETEIFDNTDEISNPNVNDQIENNSTGKVKSLEELTDLLNDVAVKEFTELTNNDTMRQLSKILIQQHLETVQENTENHELTENNIHTPNIQLLEDASVSELNECDYIEMENSIESIKNISEICKNNEENNNLPETLSNVSINHLTARLLSINSVNSNQFYQINSTNDDIKDNFDSSDKNELAAINDAIENNEKIPPKKQNIEKTLTKTTTFFMEINHDDNNVIANTIDIHNKSNENHFIYTRIYQNFFTSLNDSVKNNTDEILLLNARIQQLKSLINIDEEFCNNLQLTLLLSDPNNNIIINYNKYPTIKFYDKIVTSMKCVKFLKNLFKNLEIPVSIVPKCDIYKVV